jgi:AraC-like DNA-binding protein
MFRLRAVEGQTLDQIAERFGVTRERVRQLLRLHFGLDGVPPAAKRRAPVRQRPSTFGERRRLYLLARVAVKRYYQQPLTLEVVAKALASSPRQLQRAYAQFGDHAFHDDLVGRRMDAAVELLSLPSIAVSDVAQRVGYRHAPHFARAFRRRYGVSPSVYRNELSSRARGATLEVTGQQPATPEVVAA